MKVYIDGKPVEVKDSVSIHYGITNSEGQPLDIGIEATNTGLHVDLWDADQGAEEEHKSLANGVLTVEKLKDALLHPWDASQCEGGCSDCKCKKEIT